MTGPAVLEHERTAARAGKYSLTFFDGKGPVIIQGPYGLWNAQGEDARMIIKHLQNPGDVEHYLNRYFEERLSRLQGEGRESA
jgi:hypothetical protein